MAADRAASTEARTLVEQPVHLVGSVLLVVWSIPFFLLIDTKNAMWMVGAVVMLSLGLGATYGPRSALFAGMLEPRFRYSGSSVGYAVGAMLGGGFAPLIAAALYGRTGTSMAISYI